MHGRVDKLEPRGRARDPPCMQVPMVRPELGEAEVEAVARVIRSGWVAQGSEVAAFERELAAIVGAPFAVAASNCTSAMELCLRALGIGRGDDVATVSHSFIATANAIVAVGARPIFVDIDPATYGMDPAQLDAALTPQTRAILCVHQLGFPCDLSGILDVALKRALPVIEDAACAIGSEIQLGGAWQTLGRPHGLVACFSFHPRKVVTTGDGGMITTAAPALAERLRRLRQHAMAGAGTVQRDGPRVTFESFLEPAYNLRMTDMQAALARPQLARLQGSIAARRALAERYRQALDDHRLLQPPRELPWMRANFQSYPLRLRDGAHLSQLEIMQHLLDRGVASRRGVDNAHMEPAYATTPWSCGPEPCDAELHRQERCRRLRCSEEARDKTILVPLFHGMREEEQDHVIATLRALPA